jgi:DNA-binding MarR family transcriptional regulator
VTRLVDRLEADGLVARHRCDRDRRVVYIAITDKGLTLLDEMTPR